MTNRGTICDPVPSKLKAESGELNEQVKVTFILQTATSAELGISVKNRLQLSANDKIRNGNYLS